jgi:hypothetical protein
MIVWLFAITISRIIRPVWDILDIDIWQLQRGSSAVSQSEFVFGYLYLMFGFQKS